MTPLHFNTLRFSRTNPLPPSLYDCLSGAARLGQEESARAATVRQSAQRNNRSPASQRPQQIPTTGLLLVNYIIKPPDVLNRHLIIL